MVGWRKVIMFTEALICFGVILWLLQLKDSAAIIAVGSMISVMVGSVVYGNIKVHQATAENAGLSGTPVPQQYEVGR